MKSRLFSEFNPAGEGDFERDLRRAVTLTPAQAQVAAGASAEFVLARLDRTREALCSDLARKTQVPLYEIKASLSLYGFFLRMLTQDKFSNDTPEDLVNDLNEVGLITAEHRPTLMAGLETVKIVALSSLEEIDKDRAAIGVLPSFEWMGFTVELRAVTRPDFLAGDKADAYEPRIVGFVPVVSIKIRLDSGEPNEICFQCDESQFNLLMEYTKAAEKELMLLKRQAKSLDSPR